MNEKYKIKFEDGVTFDCAVQPLFATRNFRGQSRGCLIIELVGSLYETIAAKFVDGATFSILAYEKSTSIDGEGNSIGEYVWTEYPKENFTIYGDITDHRDGKFTVLVGQKSEIEILEEENAALLYENLTGEEF